jgi:hypothetical protein
MRTALDGAVHERFMTGSSAHLWRRSFDPTDAAEAVVRIELEMEFLPDA